MKGRALTSAVRLAALAGLFALLLGMPGQTQAGRPIKSVAADFSYFGFEAATALEPPGIPIYRKTVFIPAAANVLYVTMSTTGDTHDGAASCFTCLIDGAFCNPGGQGAARCAAAGTVPVAGWITLNKLPAGHGGTNCNDGAGGTGDCHDNSIHYRWCTPVERGTHTIELRMASNTAGATVFIEQAHFYIDETKIQGDNRCVELPPPAP